MTYREAFEHIRDYAMEHLLSSPRRDLSAADRKNEDAVLISLNAMQKYSGCFLPGEQIPADRVPSRRKPKVSP